MLAMHMVFHPLVDHRLPKLIMFEGYLVAAQAMGMVGPVVAHDWLNIW